MSSSANRIVQIGVRDIAESWPWLHPLAKRFCDESHGTLTPGKVLYDLLHETKQAFVVGDLAGLLITEIVAYPAARTLIVVGVAGDGWSEWGPAAVAHCEAFGRSQGCTRIEGIGRGGWVRALEKYGWQRLATITGKEL